MRALPDDLNKRIWGVDLLRAAAILMVLFSHGRKLLYPVVGTALAKPLRFGGFLGVELFFVLSGFLIGLILIKTIRTEGNFDFGVLKKFWVRRWFRTLPNYYLILVVNSILLISLEGKYPWEKTQYVLYWVFLQNYQSSVEVFFGESWSLAVEEWFYLTIPVLMLVVYHTFKKWSLKNRLLLSILLYLAVFLVIRILWTHSGVEAWNDKVRMVLPLRLDSIGIGVFFAWLFTYMPSLWQKWRKPALILGLLLFVCNIVYYLQVIIPNVDGQTTWFDNTLYFLFTDFSFALLLPYAASIKVNASFFGKFITLTSIISYSLYLVHISIVRRLIEAFLSFDGRWSAALTWLLFISGSYILSYFLFVYFEKPTLSLRDRFGRSKKTVSIS